MKSILIFIAVLFVNLTANGQNLFLIGEKSYPCTDAIKLKANSSKGSDLNVFICKDGKSGVLAVSLISRGKFIGKLIIYLKDGSVITCENPDVTESVDDFAKALYKLTNDQVNNLRKSNIHTVKYSINFSNYSASNKEILTQKIISEFFFKD